MVTIRLNTWVDAPVERCFRLATSVDFHIAASLPIKERPIDGVTAGLMQQGQTITWQGRHLGLRLTYATRMDISRPCSYFRSVMVSGALRHYEHEHHFAVMDDGTRVRDELHFTAPLGPLGRVLEKLVLRPYLIQLLRWRNAALKRVAESEEWHKYLDGPDGSPTKVTTRENQPDTFMTLERGVQE
jgi:ligand-binding SRPBCC domain-containing protein